MAFESCKKKPGDNPSGEKYPLTNLQLKLTGQERATGSLIVAYEVKNISAKDYIMRENSANLVIVRITAFTTDGNIYTDDYELLDLLSNKTAAYEFALDVTAGKTADTGKTKLEFI
ncbi:hypothetical protein [Pedobacter sp.]|uniref:hypothetical protein n=1 Tax=Pedobacter sp. TaxID=1411316 RepID=UPI0031DA9014